MSTGKKSSKELEMDAGIDELDGFFDAAEQGTAPTSGHVDDTVEHTPPKKTSARKPAKHKPGIYFSKTLMHRMDREYTKQPYGNRKSKSLIVENILREKWGMPPLEE